MLLSWIVNFKDKIKKYTKIAVAIIMIIMAIVVYSLYKTNVSLREANENITNELAAKTDGEKVLIDKLGNYYTQNVAYQKDIKKIKEDLDSVEYVIYNQAKLNGIKDKRIKELESYLLSTTGNISSTVDTLFVNDFVSYKTHFDNGYMIADVTLDNDSSFISYSYQTPIYRIKHLVVVPNKFFLFRWLGIFKKRTYEAVDYKAADTNARISNIIDIEIK